MYVNKCTKCGSEFETKNPKRVICPNCLYPDKNMAVSSDSSNDKESGNGEAKSFQQENQQSNKNQDAENSGEEKQQPTQQNFYSSYSQDPPQQRPQQGGYNRPPQQGGYNQDRGGYNRPPQQGGYNRPQGGYNRPPQQGGYNRPQGGYNRPQGGAPNRFNRPPMNRNKPLLIDREQLEQIELLYKAMLPLPNPDAHEIIGAKIELEPRKVFFGINLIRQKMMLPKIPFPKRKLAISPDQMFAIQNLYEPLLPLPPIGCHKIIASQLKMDEWRVHVGIGLIRAKLGLERWNQERADAPEEFKKSKANSKADKKAEEKKDKKAKKIKEPKEKKVKETKTKKSKNKDAE